MYPLSASTQNLVFGFEEYTPAYLFRLLTWVKSPLVPEPVKQLEIIASFSNSFTPSLELVHMHFSAAAPNVWNYLPSHLRHATTHETTINKVTSDSFILKYLTVLFDYPLEHLEFGPFFFVASSARAL